MREDTKTIQAFSAFEHPKEKPWGDISPAPEGAEMVRGGASSPPWSPFGGGEFPRGWFDEAVGVGAVEESFDFVACPFEAVCAFDPVAPCVCESAVVERECSSACDGYGLVYDSAPWVRPAQALVYWAVADVAVVVGGEHSALHLVSPVPVCSAWVSSGHGAVPSRHDRRTECSLR